MLNYEFPPMGGGAGNATRNIALELAKMGHLVTIVTSRYGGQPSFEKHDNLTILRVRSYRKSIHDCGFAGAYSYLFFAYALLVKLRFVEKQKFDVVHYFFGLPTGIISLMPFVYSKVPSVVSLRGSDVPYYDIFNRKVHCLGLVLRPLSKLVWKRARHVVALSRGLREIALRTSPHQVIDVIPNGIETEIFKPLPTRKNGQGLKLITVSRLINRKGIDHVLKALAELEDDSIELLIVGLGPFEVELKRLTQQLGLGERVQFYGYCPRDQLTMLYNKADVFILPSLAESFGLVFAEAMACGLPVIGGRTSGVPELVVSENGILVEPGNIDEIKVAIEKMRDSRKVREEMGVVNRGKVVSQYSWTRIAMAYHKIYNLELTR